MFAIPKDKIETILSSNVNTARSSSSCLASGWVRVQSVHVSAVRSEDWGGGGLGDKSVIHLLTVPSYTVHLHTWRLIQFSLLPLCLHKGRQRQAQSCTTMPDHADRTNFCDRCVSQLEYNPAPPSSTPPIFLSLPSPTHSPEIFLLSFSISRPPSLPQASLDPYLARTMQWGAGEDVHFCSHLIHVTLPSWSITRNLRCHQFPVGTFLTPVFAFLPFPSPPTPVCMALDGCTTEDTHSALAKMPIWWRCLGCAHKHHHHHKVICKWGTKQATYLFVASDALVYSLKANNMQVCRGLYRQNFIFDWCLNKHRTLEKAILVHLMADCREETLDVASRVIYFKRYCWKIGYT